MTVHDPNLDLPPWPDAYSPIPVPYRTALDILHLLLEAVPQRGIDRAAVRLLVNLAREIDRRDGQSLNPYYVELVADWCDRHGFDRKAVVR